MTALHRTPAGPRPAGASRNGRGWVVEPEAETTGLGELVPKPVPVRVSLARGDERTAVQLAVRRGVTDVNRLTDLVFQRRHPERGGRPIRRDEQTLAREWADIREHVVRPLLASASVAAPAPAAVGAFRPVPVESPGGGRVRDKRDPAPSDVVTVRGVNGPVPLHRLAAQAWAAMVSAARADGIAQPLLLPVSGYRSSAHQNRLWQHALARYGSAEEARKWVAPPGSSAHQSGRAVDMYLGARNDSSNVPKLRGTPAYQWLVVNAQRFGFYPYEREPWHWEYNPPAAGTAHELELEIETDRIPSSGLEWPGASADLLAFMRAVYERHVERQKAAGGAFTGDLPKSQLETIEGGHEARKDAARAARAMLAEARSALAAERLASRVHIGIVSAYRSAGLQFQIWQGKGRQGGFPYYYRQLLKKGRLRPGDYGPQAVEVAAREIAQWVAAPGYSNHQDGLAIDFGIGEVGKGLGKIGPRSWLYRWLTANARRFGFHPYAKEAWHWTYRPGTESEVWSGEVGAGGIRAGRLEVATVPVLARHLGKAPALVLRWNDMPSATAEIDVVVNLHGFSRPWLTLPRDIEPTSGLDLAPVDGATGRGRSRPTLTILPRAHYTGVQQKGGPLYVYTFPALDGTDGRRDGIARLIQFSLDQFASSVGGTAPRVGRLILTAHSGGGQPLLRILRFMDPHEVHVYDALYWEASALAAWARKHIAQDRAASAGAAARDYMSTRGGAMRVFYRGPTRGNSRAVHNAIAAQLGGGIENWYRVEASPLGHWEIPRTYGWRVLADASADVPRAAREPTRQRESRDRGRDTARQHAAGARGVRARRAGREPSHEHRLLRASPRARRTPNRARRDAARAGVDPDPRRDRPPGAAPRCGRRTPDGADRCAGGDAVHAQDAEQAAVGGSPPAARPLPRRYPDRVPARMDRRRVRRARRRRHVARRARVLPAPSRRVARSALRSRAADQRPRLLSPGRNPERPLLRQPRAAALPVDPRRLGALLARGEAPARARQSAHEAAPGRHARERDPVHLGGDQAVGGDARAATPQAAQGRAARTLRPERRRRVHARPPAHGLAREVVRDCQGARPGDRNFKRTFPPEPRGAPRSRASRGLSTYPRG